MIQQIKHKQVGKFEDTTFEKIHNEIFEDSYEASKIVAAEIADLIREKQEKGEACVLGLATGSASHKGGEELLKVHKNWELSCHNVITFNLDEYYPMDTENRQSYYYYMHQHLFDHIDIKPENIHIPNGQVSQEEL